jgi:hypothetical protein
VHKKVEIGNSKENIFKENERKDFSSGFNKIHSILTKVHSMNRAHLLGWVFHNVSRKISRPIRKLLRIVCRWNEIRVRNIQV